VIAVSLKLPDELAEESRRVADQIGVSRTELIRIALQHELERIARQREQAAMAASFRAMRDAPAYVKDAELIDAGMSDPLPEEPEAWWQS
jgi:metal-responsive CopG/Arc/MetJ family transcriptional regulator